jgi:hypothetical protein
MRSSEGCLGCYWFGRDERWLQFPARQGSLTYIGVMMSSGSKRDVLSTITAEATRPDPMRHANLLVGLRRVPPSPRFLKLCITTTLLLTPTSITATVSSLEIIASFTSLAVKADHAVVNTAEFLLPALFEGRELRNACHFENCMFFFYELGQRIQEQ